jgi:hypothetical protein
VAYPQSITTYKRIKELTPEEQKAQEQKQKTLRDSVIGEYEFKLDGNTYKKVYLENGVFEWYANGIEQVTERKWSIVDGQLHVKTDSGEIVVHRINAGKSITRIAKIVDGNRTDYPKEDQRTWKKIK